MINVAICDDDIKYANSLALMVERAIRRKLQECVVMTYSSGRKLIQSIEMGQQFDLLFLDIDMPEISGKEVASLLRKKNRLFKLVFVSSYEKEVFDVFEFDPSSFIPKNSVSDKLEREVQRILEEMLSERKSWGVYTVYDEKNEKITVKIPLKDVIYIETVNKTSMLYTNTKQMAYNLGRVPIEQLEDKYQSYGFRRTDRSTLVNLGYVRRVNPDCIVLDDGREIHLSRRRYAKLEEDFLQYVYENNFL